MSADTTSRRAEQVSKHLADVTIGEMDTDIKLSGIGNVTVADGTATIQMTISIPPGPTRETLEGKIRDAALRVKSITAVDVVWEPAIPDSGRRVDYLPSVKNIVAVASGKGGVGKSTVATNLAVMLAQGGAEVGLLDADVYGPNAPAMLGISNRTPTTTLNDQIQPRMAHGVKTMSMGFLAGEDDPVIWRGALVDDSLKQLLADVQWGPLDYLIIDLPPGTGDAQLTLTQFLPLTGAVIVTTPQPIAARDAERGLRAFDRYDVPILGIVENMGRFNCPDCGSTYEIFGVGGAQELSEKFTVPVLGRIPLDPAVGASNDEPRNSNPRGIEVPLIGRLELPRTHEEREREEHRDPVVIQNNGKLREAFELMSARTAARIDHLTTSNGDKQSEES